jgi:hypothetical protein
MAVPGVKRNGPNDILRRLLHGWNLEMSAMAVVSRMD